MRETVVDLADAIATGGAPAADGAAALHTMETTIAAYASAALGRTVALPLPTEDRCTVPASDCASSTSPSTPSSAAAAFST